MEIINMTQTLFLQSSSYIKISVLWFKFSILRYNCGHRLSTHFRELGWKSFTGISAIYRSTQKALKITPKISLCIFPFSLDFPMRSFHWKDSMRGSSDFILALRERNIYSYMPWGPLDQLQTMHWFFFLLE